MMRIAWRKAATPAVLLGALTFLLHLIANGSYGVFRDELYFIVCGRHLVWGYVDQPPLVPLIAAGSWALGGGSITLLRLAPALVLALTVGATAEFTRALGGGRFAQWLAGICVLANPLLLAMGVLVSTDVFQPLTWLGAGWCLVHFAKTRDERWWYAFAVIVAFGLWSKYAIVFFVAALAVAVVATPLRRSFARPQVYLAAGLTALLVLPNVWWQAAHGFPFLELGEAGTHGKNLVLSPVAFFAQQILLLGPCLALVWIAGLIKFAVKPSEPSWRLFAIAYVLLAAFFIVAHGKAYYLMSIYPILFAGGALAWEGWLKPLWARSAALAVVVGLSVPLVPLGLPILSEESYIAYADAIGLSPKATVGENMKLGRLPQHYADMHGWPEMAAKIAAVYHALPPADRAKAVFYGRNYGEAAAIDVYGAKLGLPPAISGHNNYWLWGPHGADGSVVIEIGGTRAEHLADFRSVEAAGMVENPYAVPYETGQTIWIERGLKVPLSSAWPRVKHYD